MSLPGPLHTQPMLHQRSVVAAVAAASIAVLVFAACSLQPAPPAKTTGQQTPATTPAASSLDSPVSPTDFVTAHAADANSVVAAVQEVQQREILWNESGGSDPPTSASFDAVMSDAQSTFDKVNKVLLDAPKPKGVESGETEMWSATDELSNAMKSARAYVDDQKPSELADWHKHWDTGRAWWNQAVTPIWQAASVPPPTLDNAPTAPPVS
jgi:hypothetical protein